MFRARGFALDGEHAGVSTTWSLVKTARKSTSSLAHQNLFAQLAGVGWPEAVFGMDIADIGTEDVDCIDRIGLAVEDEVGHVEADAQVGHGDVADGAQHGDRRLLARFHQECLAIALAVLGNGADSFDGSRIERVSWILGNKTAMRLHLENANLLGKIGRLAQGIDAGGAGFGRHQADGGRSTGKVPLQGAWTHYLDGSGRELVLRQQIAELSGQGWCKAADVLVERRKQVEKPSSCTARKCSSGEPKGVMTQPRAKGLMGAGGAAPKADAGCSPW